MSILVPPLDVSNTRSPNLLLRAPAASPAIEGRERRLDQVLADSFPASDPPPWTLGKVTANHSARTNPAPNDERFYSVETTVVVAGPRTAWQWLRSGIGAILVAMLVPIAILTIGLPIALVVRAILEIVGWLARRMAG